MRCPNCQGDVRDGAAFCGSCGASIVPPAHDAAAQPTVPLPTAVTPTAPAVSAPIPQSDAGQAEYARQMAEYQRKQAEYEQQKAAYEQYQRQTSAAQPAYQQSVSAQPAKRGKTGLMIGIVIGVIVLLGGLVVAGILVARNLAGDAVRDLEQGVETPAGDATGGDATPDDAGDSESGSGEARLGDPSGLASADEAVQAALDKEGLSDWVYQVYQEDAGSIVYWTGPPASEWVSEVTVVQSPDGTWGVTSMELIQTGGDVPLTPADEAMNTVMAFLTALQEDRPEDGQALTIEPFSLDPASAAYSNGQFTAWEILSAEEQSDGTVWVGTSETWYGTTESWNYYVVPTEAGYRIANLEPL